MPNITSITPPRVPITDPRTGLITREWYRFLLNLFTLTGNGISDTSIQDLQLGPVGNSDEVLERVNKIYSQFYSQPTDISSELQAQINDLKQLVLTTPAQPSPLFYAANTFAPTLKFGGAATGITYTTDTGQYIQIGSFVSLNIDVLLTSKGSATGDATITGDFPAAVSNSVGSFDPVDSLSGLTAGGAVIPTISGSTIYLLQQTITARAALTDTNFTNTSNFRLTINYAT